MIIISLTNRPQVLTVKGVPDPLEDKKPFYVLIETSGSNVDHDKEVSKTREGEGSCSEQKIRSEQIKNIKHSWLKW